MISGSLHKFGKQEMHICETNYTVAVYALYFNNYLYAEDNRIKGRLLSLSIDGPERLQFSNALIRPLV